MNQNSPDVQAWFRKAEESDQIANTHWITEKARGLRKTPTFIDYMKPFDYVNQNKKWKFLKKWEYQATLSVSWETCMWVKKQEAEPYREQLIVSKLVNEYEKAVFVTLLI